MERERIVNGDEDGVKERNVRREIERRRTKKEEEWKGNRRR